MTGHDGSPGALRLATADEAVAHLLAHLDGLVRDRERPVIAVGGPTAAGKSTLARRFLESAGRRVPTRVLEGDRFLVPQARRPHPARFPEDVYETGRLRETVRRLAAGRTVRVPFYERDARHTGRLGVRPGSALEEVPDSLAESCRRRSADPDNPIEVDPLSGDLLEVVDPGPGLWVFDSELSLFYADLLPLYAMSYGIRASRERRKSQFLAAVRSGQRYPHLTLAEAEAKIEGFWETDDALIEPTVARAGVQIVLT